MPSLFLAINSATMSPDESMELIRDELWRCFRRAGRGSIRRTQEKLGVGDSYFQDMKGKTKKVDLRMLLATLEKLGEDPAMFFVRAFSQFQMEPPTGEPPLIVKLGRARLKELKALERKK